MEKKQVSPTQVEALFKFFRSKYVRYYDVQLELVDHFASAIEAMWEDNPAMTFDQGIDKVYSEFPITGFNNLIGKKTKILNKRILSHAWEEVKLYLQVPKIMLTFLLTTALYLFFSIVQQPMLCTYIIWVFASIISIYFTVQLRKKGSKKQQFLVLNTLTGSQCFSIFLFCSITQPQDFLVFGNLSFWPTVVLSIFTTFFILFSVGHYKVACSIFEEWKMQYPQFI